MPIRVGVAAAFVVAIVVGTGFLFRMIQGRSNGLPVQFGLSLAAQGVLVLVILLIAMVVDRRRITDLGLDLDRDWYVDLGFGVALGAILMTGIFSVSLALGWIRIVGWFTVESSTLTFWWAFAYITLFFTIAGFTEELLVRGYLLTNIAEGIVGFTTFRVAVGFAVAISSVVFGTAHVLNPNATIVSSLGIAIAGVLLAAGYVFTGDLAIPVGLHISWNLFQGPVYGFAVSGIGFGVSVIETAETGPDVATGGPFGPEAGLLGIASMGIGLLAIAGYVAVRNETLGIDRRLSQPDLRWRSSDTDKTKPRMDG